MQLPFRLDPAFVGEYRDRPTTFGWNGLGEFVFKRTYARGDEEWVDVCERVINGMYSTQKVHCDVFGIPWDEDKAQRSARESFDLLFRMTWTPPGRGLWMMGTEFIHKRRTPEALQNCAFISSAFIEDEQGDFFRWIMEMSMLGVGVGFDTKGAGLLKIRGFSRDSSVRVYEVADSREGWADSVRDLVNSYINGDCQLVFDYGRVRPAGQPIRGFGGVASGPEPLKELHRSVKAVLQRRVGGALGSRDITDISNLIGRCVVAGNVRRSAEIAIGEATDREFLDLKNYKLNPDRAEYGWVSNNSVIAHQGMDYGDVVERAFDNGEPGLIWLDNIQNYGRMNGRLDTRDRNARGMNPCGEQPLWHREMCTLVEIHLPRIRSKAEFTRTLKAAFLYGQSVSLMSPLVTDETSRNVMVTNRRIGLSLTGQAQFLASTPVNTLDNWMDYGYELTGYWNQVYANWLQVPESIRRTSVKPSGSVSLLTGSTPGVHFPVSRFHVRRVTVAANSPLVDKMLAAGYPVEPSVTDPAGTVVVEFPVDAGAGVPSESEVTLDAQFGMAARAQELWADNGVSVTVKINRNYYSPVALRNALRRYETRLKAVSMLPLDDHGYEQAPYEPIDEAEYGRRLALLKPLNIAAVSHADHASDLFCDGDTCEVY